MNSIPGEYQLPLLERIAKEKARKSIIKAKQSFAKAKKRRK